MIDAHPDSAPMPPSLADLVQRLDQARLTRTREMGEAAGTVPVGHYTDPMHWQREQALLFGQWPIVAAHSSELPIASALPFDELGVPINVDYVKYVRDE